MITSKEQLRECLEVEKGYYMPSSKKRVLQNFILGGLNNTVWKYIKNYRKYEYYFNNRNKNVCFSILNIICARKHNRLGLKLGIELSINVFEQGLNIYHTQGIVINGDAKVGRNCLLHGANVIGNKGNDLKAPVLGDNVRLGVGAKVLGHIYIADDVQIGAGAIVLHSCYEQGALLTGIPAKIHKK